MDYHFRKDYPAIQLDQNEIGCRIRKEDIQLTVRDLSHIKDVNYPISNERYSEKTLGFIRRIEGIENYIGICGGGNQNLTILSCLQKRNRLSTVRLIDDSPAQIENFYRIAMIFSLSSNSEEYQENLKSWQNRRFSGDTVEKLGFHLQELPIIKKKISIDLHISDINYYLRNLVFEGRYFIYLSNVFGYDADRLNVPLNIISEGNKFKNGTVVMSVDTRSIIRYDPTVSVSFFQKRGLNFMNYEYRVPEVARLGEIKR